MVFTKQILCIGTDRPKQTVQTLIRLLPQEQSDQGLHFSLSASVGQITAF